MIRLKRRTVARSQMTLCHCVLRLDSKDTGDLMRLLCQKDISESNGVPGFQVGGPGNSKTS